MEIISYIGFGSNIGDLTANLYTAKNFLAETPGIRLLRTSNLYQSEPLTENGEKQAWYLNTVFEIATTLGIKELLAALKGIEKKMGRTHGIKWASRVVDLDILFYGELIFRDRELRIPHAGIIQRRFVLKPLCDLNPELVHPEYDMTISEILLSSQDPLQVFPMNHTTEETHT